MCLVSTAHIFLQSPAHITLVYHFCIQGQNISENGLELIKHASILHITSFCPVISYLREAAPFGHSGTVLAFCSGTGIWPRQIKESTLLPSHRQPTFGINLRAWGFFSRIYRESEGMKFSLSRAVQARRLQGHLWHMYKHPAKERSQHRVKRGVEIWTKM